MNQFDKTTERLKIEHMEEFPGDFNIRYDYFLERGRNSVKESVVILAQAVKKMLDSEEYGDPGSDRYLEKIIAEVKSRGDWPLETVKP